MGQVALLCLIDGVTASCMAGTTFSDVGTTALANNTTITTLHLGSTCTSTSVCVRVCHGMRDYVSAKSHSFGLSMVWLFRDWQGRRLAT